MIRSVIDMIKKIAKKAKKALKSKVASKPKPKKASKPIVSKKAGKKLPTQRARTLTFTIETVKWTWPEAVKNKEVYRDDEFIRTKTAEEALAAIDFLMGKPRGLTYTITVLRDGEYFTYYRHSMPCFGGLVKYRDSHGARHFMNPYFPRDIRVAYPEGDTVFIACHRQNMVASMKNKYYQFLFSQESPWVSAFGSQEDVLFKDNYFVLTNMNTDPTVFYSLLRLAGLTGHYPPDDSWHPKAHILASKTGYADPRRLAGQKPLRISGGTWAEGFGYTRPYNESIFKLTVPTKLPDFGKLAAYPSAPHTNAHFVSEMKTVFGVDASQGITSAMNDVLVKAWDYFKEKAQELSDTP